MSTTLERTHDGRAARVTFDNASRANAFDETLLCDLVDTLEAAATDEGCAVVELVMAGPHFCGGWDTTTFPALAASGADAVAGGLRRSDELLDRIRDLPVPVVAGVRGRVIGFGAGLLAAIHLPVAARDARLLLPELGYGFTPAGVGRTLARALPRARAYGLLTGTTEADGDDLVALGLAARAVAPTDLDETLAATVTALAGLPADAVRGLVTVVESARRDEDPGIVFETSARTVLRGLAAGSRS
ncbi:enoyl-CoA hydratase/isomerase family protein [Nocardioides sp. zg-536]|uniref:Enoyl-CoA hydratase/isomerase family protein n=1 Tax=Nocardioides faecalis TaxID=2803858 RepID=A0A938Y3H0_9ACTN|nr:enoyl-CoA hydratase/isomerase family protein [Nocardioides faecalis]MBM9461176.1 enoyl-CoA hydratase/isomerase family protein [Nocardioides faecalis]QVI59025.1 enoyl-CoA hydratase/isomerase family protein [Nocardioides faecalis]